MEGDQPNWNSSAYQLNTTSNCFFNPNWDGSMDQNDPFESALSSLVSSPAASNVGAGDGFVFSELIGKLGSVCKSGEVSPQSCVAGSRNTSCYNTPLNSPPKLNLSSLTESQIRANFGKNQLPPNLGLSPFSADPGFVERAAKFSCFGSTTLGGLVGARFGSEFGHGSLPNLQGSEMGDSREGSSVSEQTLGGEFAVKPQGNASSRKRKANPKAKGPVKEAKVAENDESSNAKRSKTDEGADKEKSNTDVEENENDKDIKKETKQPEPPQDFIHVRARRGQATDSHSLAERARREKISERMKFLQDLVPGCNKVTGKAIVLDEIINYVQSLQRQVEFLSMKLATVNPRLEFNTEALLSKDILQLPPTMLPLDSSATVFPYGFQSQQIQTIPNDVHNPFSVNLLDAAIRQNTGIQMPSTDGYGDSAHQIPAFWEDDLHSIIQMGFPQNLQGTNPTTHMKVEL